MPPKRHNDLFDDLAGFPALHAAAKRAIKGKRRKPIPAAFMAGLERELLKLERELQDGTYRPGGYVEIHVKDPKPRIVSAAPFRDRVVHHALCAVIEPIFDRGFIFDSYANRLPGPTRRSDREIACGQSHPHTSLEQGGGKGGRRAEGLYQLQPR